MKHWTHVVGYEELYQVSDLGRIKRTGRSKGAHTGRVLKAQRRRGGYMKVRLYRGSQTSWADHFVHHLVAEAFIGPRTPDSEINHKNGVTGDNRATNLEWVTRSANLQHAFDVLGRDTPKGEKHHNAKLSADKVKEIRRLFATGQWTQVDLGKRFGVSQTTVWNVICRNSWKHIDYEYPEGIE